MSSINLLQETLKTLEAHNKTIHDVLWVGNGKQSFSWGEFASIANFRYYYGINKQLKVVGEDWWLERHEYDNNEWWEFKILPIPELYKAPIKKDLIDYCDCEIWELEDCDCEIWEEEYSFPEEDEHLEQVRKFKNTYIVGNIEPPCF